MREYYLSAVSSLDGAITISLKAVDDNSAKLNAHRLIAYYSMHLSNELTQCGLYYVTGEQRHINQVHLTPVMEPEIEAEEKAIADLDASAAP